MSYDMHNFNNTKWWKLNCLRLDVYDFLAGNMSLKDFKRNALYDLAWLKKLVEYEGTEKENSQEISKELELELNDTP